MAMLMAGRRRVLLAWVWCPLLLTALIRALWFSAFPGDPIGSIDAEGFHLLAVNFLEGRGFSIGWDPPFCPNTVRTPLYPLFVAGVYRSSGRLPQMVVLVQVLLEVLTTAWVIALSEVLVSAGRSPRAHKPAANLPASFIPLLAGLLYAVNGTTLRYTGQLVSEALLLPLLTAALYWTLRLLRRPTLARAICAGAFWGFAVLTKPNIQFLALTAGALVVVSVLVAARRQNRGQRLRRSTIAFWAVFFLVVMPWIARNRHATGRWMFSSAFEDNLARVSAVATQAALLGLDVEPWTASWESLYGRLVIASGWGGRPEDDLSCGEQLRRRRDIAVTARELVSANLGLYVREHLRGTAQSILDPGHELWYRVLTGNSWQATGVVSDIWGRMAWSLERGAWGDALQVFWHERVVLIPWNAAMVWWGLVLGRLAVVGLCALGTWRLRGQPSTMLLLLGAIVYQIMLPGPIAHDRFYLAAIPAVSVLVARGAGGYNERHHGPLGYRRPR